MKWVEVDTKIKGYGQDIVYANEKYYLSHYNPNGIAVSEDLKVWKDIILDSEKLGRANNIAYGNSTFIVTGEAGNLNKTYIYISKDGINWNFKELNTGQSFSMHNNTCKFLNNKFIFFTGYHNYNTATGIRNYTVTQIYETKNGDSIRRHDFKYIGSKNISAMDIAYGNGIYVLIGESGTIFTSKNLDNWTERKSGVNTRLVGISYGKGYFVVTGADGVILISQDGMNWTLVPKITDSYLIRSRYANGIYLAVGYNGTILSSINAIDWIEENDPFFRTVLYGLAFADNRFVVSAGRYTDTQTIPITYSEITRELSYSSDDSLYVFNDDLELVGVIDNFISLRWRRKYYEAGEFELVVAPFENNLKYLQKGNLVVRKNYTEAAIIDTKEYQDDGSNIELKVSGNFLSYLLHRRIIKKVIHYSGNIIDGGKELLVQMTPLTNRFEIEPTYLESDNIEFQCTYKNVYDYEVKLAKLSNIGFRVVPSIETKVYRYENFKGKDRTINQTQNERYCFSKENCNIDKITSIDTDVNKCNYALVGGSGEGNTRILKEVKYGNPTGFDLFEVFVDAKSESNQNLSNQQYLNILETKGKEVLKDETTTVTFTGKEKDYRDKWDLGDIVNVNLPECLFKDEKRITEVEEVIEDGKKSIFPSFGPLLAEQINLD